nr:ribonuclease H-like domain, reverse transcriptase, RNA-dependent DNA polymerase [Tanacetum cinerariifolium]
MQDPKDHHLKAVIRYIKGTKEHGIIYKKEGGCKITGYSDSSYGINTDQGKETTGIVFYFGESPITWCTQKQPTVALSSCEPEFMAATGAACQALWLKRLLSELTGWEEERITLKVDNILAIALVRNPVFLGRSKHIDIRYHFIRECVENGHINVEHVSGELQRADILTKALPRLNFGDNKLASRASGYMFQFGYEEQEQEIKERVVFLFSSKGDNNLNKEWAHQCGTRQRGTTKSRYFNKGSTKIEVRDDATNARSSRFRMKQRSILRRRM